MGNQYSEIPEEKMEVSIVKCDNSFTVFIQFGKSKLKIKSFEFEPHDQIIVAKKALNFIDNKLIPRLHELFTFEDE